MLTTAGITFATARTAGSEAGSVGVDDGSGVGVCAMHAASPISIASVETRAATGLYAASSIVEALSAERRGYNTFVSFS